MRVRYNAMQPGPGPSEAIVTVTTADGRAEEVIVQREMIEGDVVEIGYIVDRRDDNASLVELVRESASGKWRLWIGDSAAA